MYISAQVAHNRRDVLLWERNEKGKRTEKTYAAPYNFFIQDDAGKFKDIYNNKLMKLEFKDSKSFYDAKQRFKDSGVSLYESDIAPEYKILSSKYFGSPIPQLHITFFDIEVDYDKTIGFSTIENPYAPISSIAIYHKHKQQFLIFAVPPSKDWTLDKISPDILEKAAVKLVNNESELLKLFYNEIEDSDIISGWNSDYFDVPYVYERAKRVLGEAYANRLSFTNAMQPKYKEIVDKYGVPRKVLNIFGRISIDSLAIYKKFEVSDKASFSLEAVADDKLPELPKLEYDGSLADLYKNDFDYFIRYNLRDCEILKGLDDKLGYLELAIHMSHMACGKVNDIIGTIKLAELAIINYCHTNLNSHVPDSVQAMSTSQYAGALVLEPQVGMHELVAAIDLASLYPSSIRSINASPETVIGQFFELHNAHDEIFVRSNIELMLQYENGNMETRTAAEWANYIKENNWTLSGYGTVFTQHKQGFIPAILESWFTERKEYKRRNAIAKEKMSTIGDKNSKEYKLLKQEAEYSYRVQYIKKIQLNSLYGALGNSYFKFYDVRLAESTTRTGQKILMHMVKKTAEILDGHYMWPSESTIYSDTDSCYFKTHATNGNDAVKIGTYVQKTVNNSFPEFMQNAFFCNNEYSNYITSELDVVSSKSIFIKKKYYVMHLIYKEGSSCNEMKIMGLQIKKTTIPKEVGKKLAKFIELLLTGTSWREISEDIVKYKDELLMVNDVLRIGLPKGISKVEGYTQRFVMNDPTLKLPGHIAAALCWNKCIDEFNDVENYKISTGMKIKVFYLKRQIGKFTSIAVPTDINKLPSWFIDKFEPLIDREKQINRLVDMSLKTILDAIHEHIPTKKTLLFDDIFGN